MGLALTLVFGGACSDEVAGGAWRRELALEEVPPEESASPNSCRITSEPARVAITWVTEGVALDIEARRGDAITLLVANQSDHDGTVQLTAQSRSEAGRTSAIVATVALPAAQ